MTGTSPQTEGRRTKAHIDSQAPEDPNGVDHYRHFYYNAGWQILETRKATSENTEPETLNPEVQYVWSLRYIDAPILRDENGNADGDCTDDPGDERLYYTTDANTCLPKPACRTGRPWRRQMNVTALTNTGGDAQERYVYDPYGNVAVLDADWSATASIMPPLATGSRRI